VGGLPWVAGFLVRPAADLCVSLLVAACAYMHVHIHMHVSQDEPLIVMEALSALTSLCVSGDAACLQAVRGSPLAVPSIHRLLMRDERPIRRHALISLLYLRRRLEPCAYDKTRPSHSAETRCSICWLDYAPSPPEAPLSVGDPAGAPAPSEGCGLASSNCRPAEAGGLVVELPDCNHVFHHSCINSWLLGHQHSTTAGVTAPECPLCKGPLSLTPM